jgi:hypothetical protein
VEYSLILSEYYIYINLPTNNYKHWTKLNDSSKSLKSNEKPAETGDSR